MTDPSKALPPAYPDRLEVDVVLRDGSTIEIRPVKPDDLSDMVDLFARLSQRSLRQRFHGLVHVDEHTVEPFVDVDYRASLSLVALTSAGEGPRIVAAATYITTAESKAEMAIAIDDPFQGRGLGSVMIEHLTEAASDAGINTFEAEVQAENADMLEVLDGLDLPMTRRTEHGILHVEFPTELTAEGIAAFESREAIASAAGVARFLEPRSIAVIGASRRRDSIAGAVFHKILEGGFTGPVYPVNPNSDVVQSVPAYPSVSEVPGPVDLAVIVVPARFVLTAARECAEKGVKALLVISAGFAEIGGEGLVLQDALMRVARDHGMRVIGPNCMGIINTDVGIGLDATFAPVVALPGNLAFSSQSGALGIAVIDRANELGLGLSSFVSVGNKADISGNDLLQYWERDDRTDVILLYLESFGNPRKFARIARRVALKKPIVAVKSGRSTAGARAAASHTGSMVAGDVAVDALFQQAGVIRTDTLEELFDVAALLAHQPIPDGDRVAILTNAGGLGILCADACDAAGLKVPDLAEETLSELKALLPDEASVINPVDMIASASAEDYGKALEIVERDPNVDSVIVIFIPPLVTKAADVARAVVAAASGSEKTVMTCFLGGRGVHDLLRSEGCVIPSYAFPEDAARALGSVVGYARWSAKPRGKRLEPDADTGRSAGLASRIAEGGERWLEPGLVDEVLTAYGIDTVRTLEAKSPEDVAACAADIAGPVVVKLVSQRLVHKSDVGGVRLDLKTPEEARAAALEIQCALSDRGEADALEGFVVQEMGPADAVEMFAGVTHDPSFGPLIACGAGGVLVELMGDVNVRIAPLTDVDAHEMVAGLRTARLLTGYRGRTPVDVASFEELLMRLSVLVEEVPVIGELDLNPVLVSPNGSTVVDARIRIVEPHRELPRGARTKR